MHFDSRVEIHADASLTVTETIRVYAAGKEIKRGIYRDFPQAYRGRWGCGSNAIQVLQVRRDGNRNRTISRRAVARGLYRPGDVMLAPASTPTTYLPYQPAAWTLMSMTSSIGTSPATAGSSRSTGNGHGHPAARRHPEGRQGLS